MFGLLITKMPSKPLVWLVTWTLIGLGLPVMTQGAHAAGDAAAGNFLVTAPDPTGLDRYLARPEPAYGWKVSPTAKAGETDLELTSQTWQGHDWKHSLQIFAPHPVAGATLHDDCALIWLQAGATVRGGTGIDQYTANLTGAYVVDLDGVPNEPIDGYSENALVAYSFARYFQTGDETWPVLLPMTKSAVAAMTAIGEWSAKAAKRRITRFIIAGTSKRGWTTYLVAEHDKRVVGSIPFVYNFLDIPDQLELQHTEWNAVSEQMQDFVDAGLMTKLDTASGHDLLDSVDPWNYRQNLTAPRLVVLATNDRYWPPDALNIYLDGLPGRTDLLFVPNVGHSLGDEIAPTLQSTALWTRGLLDGTPQPALQLTADAAGGLHLHTGSPLSGPMTLWYAVSPGTDFRMARWRTLPLASGSDAPATDFTGKLPDSTNGNVLAFADTDLTTGNLHWQLSSNLVQWKH